MDRPRVLIVWAIVAAAPAGAFARGADPAISCVVCPAGGAYAPPAGVEAWTTFWMGPEKATVVEAPRSLGRSLAPAGGRCIAVEEPAPGEALFVVESPRGLDVDLLSRSTRIQALGGTAALVVATQRSAEGLAAGGMEIRAVRPPHRHPRLDRAVAGGGGCFAGRGDRAGDNRQDHRGADRRR